MATPQFIKNFSRSPFLRALTSSLGALYIRLVHATGNWKHEGFQIPEKFWAEGKPFIACFWHGRLMMMPYNWRRDVPFYMLISGHADGQLIAPGTSGDDPVQSTVIRSSSMVTETFNEIGSGDSPSPSM